MYFWQTLLIKIPGWFVFFFQTASSTTYSPETFIWFSNALKPLKLREWINKLWFLAGMLLWDLWDGSNPHLLNSPLSFDYLWLPKYFIFLFLQHPVNLFISPFLTTPSMPKPLFTDIFFLGAVGFQLHFSSPFSHCSAFPILCSP